MGSVSIALGEKIRMYRKLKGMTAQDLGNAIHKSKATVSKYENGEIIIDVETLNDIASVLSVDISFFFDSPALSPVKPLSHPGLFSQRDVYMYHYDGRYKRICRSMIRTGASADDRKVTMYVDYYDKPENCRALYHGKIEYFDVVTGLYLINQSNDVERVSIYAMNGLNAESANYGLLLGLSDYPLLPVVMKCLYSQHPLPIDDDLKNKLLITPADIKLSKSLNMFSVEKIFDR